MESKDSNLKLGICDLLQSFVDQKIVKHNYANIQISELDKIKYGCILDKTYQKMVKFKLTDKSLDAKLQLAECVLGDIEFEMDVPDDTFVSVFFYNDLDPKGCLQKIMMNKRFTSSKYERLIDAYLYPEIDMDLYKNKLIAMSEDIFKSDPEISFLDSLKFDLFDYYDTTIKNYQSSLTIRIHRPEQLPIRDEYCGIFKCKYRKLHEHEKEIIRTIKEDKGNQIEALEKVQSLYS